MAQMCRTVVDFMVSFPGTGFDPSGQRIVWHIDRPDGSGFIDAHGERFVITRIESPDFPCKPRGDGTPIDVQLPSEHYEAYRMLFNLAGLKEPENEDEK